MPAVTELEADLVLETGAEVGEGPTWDPLHRQLVWVDIPRGAVHRFDPDTGVDMQVEVGQPVGAAVVRADGGLLLAARDGFLALDDGVPGLVAPVEADRPGNRMNDAKVDPGGRCWAGTMALDVAPGQGSLYRLTPEGDVATVLTGLTIPNGMDWTSDATRMYFIDSTERTVTAFSYDVETGAIADPRVVVRLNPQEGMPDGMTLDAEDHLWVAIWDGWAVRRYAPDGTLEARVQLPVGQVTSCAFGGVDMADLYITCAAEGLSAERRSAPPDAGALFHCRPGIRGRAPHLFGQGV